ncbi:MAG: hypothetical protein AB7V16_13715, partial [Vulcanibacillus sp.]
MEFSAALGREGGRTVIAYTIVYFFVVCSTLALFMYTSNLFLFLISIVIVSLIYIRYMYYLLSKKPMLYIEDNFLYCI